MKLTNVHYDRIGNHPVLRFDLDGRSVTLGTDVKPIVYDACYVFLGPQFVDVFPQVDLAIAEDDGGGTLPLRGCTNKPEIFHLFRDFLKACNEGTFVVGTVANPTVQEPVAV